MNKPTVKCRNMFIRYIHTEHSYRKTTAFLSSRTFAQLKPDDCKKISFYEIPFIVPINIKFKVPLKQKSHLSIQCGNHISEDWQHHRQVDYDRRHRPQRIILKSCLPRFLIDEPAAYLGAPLLVCRRIPLETMIKHDMYLCQLTATSIM